MQTKFSNIIFASIIALVFALSGMLLVGNARSVFADTSFTITFDANGGEGTMENIITDENGYFTVPECTITPPENKQFAYWSTTSTGDGIKIYPSENAEDKYKTTSNMDLYAIWRAQQMHLSFYASEADMHNASDNVIIVDVDYNGDYEFLTLDDLGLVAPTGKVFKTWKSGTTDYQAGTTISNVTEDLFFYATYNEKTISISAEYWGEYILVGGILNRNMIDLIFTNGNEEEWIDPNDANVSFLYNNVLVDNDFIFTRSMTGDVDITVKYQYGTGASDVCETTMTISVYAASGLAAYYDREDVYVSNRLIPNALEVYLVYQNEDEKPISKWSVDYFVGTDEIDINNYTFATAGESVITMKYNDDGVEITGEWTIEVSPSFTVSYVANGGTGTMEAQHNLYDVYTLKTCKFTPPANKRFYKWLVDDEYYNPGDIIALTEDTVITAVWTDNVYVENFTIDDALNGFGTDIFKQASLAGQGVTFNFEGWKFEFDVEAVKSIATTPDARFKIEIFTPKKATNEDENNDVATQGKYKMDNMQKIYGLFIMKNVGGSSGYRFKSIEKIAGNVSVTIPLDFELQENKLLKVYGVDRVGDTVDTNAIIVDNCIQFSMNQFGDYIVVLEDPASSDYTIWILIGSIGGVIILGVIAMLIASRKRK